MLAEIVEGWLQQNAGKETEALLVGLEKECLKHKHTHQKQWCHGKESLCHTVLQPQLIEYVDPWAWLNKWCGFMRAGIAVGIFFIFTLFLLQISSTTLSANLSFHNVWAWKVSWLVRTAQKSSCSWAPQSFLLSDGWVEGAGKHFFQAESGFIKISGCVTIC